MDFSKIYENVEANRPLSLLSSLPVIVEKGNHLEVLWFNYSFKKNEQEGTVSVFDIFTTEDGENITEEKVQIQKKVTRCEQEAPNMDETEYYEQLEQLYQKFNADIMQELLRQAVFKPFLHTYEMVMNYSAELQVPERTL